MPRRRRAQREQTFRGASLEFQECVEQHVTILTAAHCDSNFVAVFDHAVVCAGHRAQAHDTFFKLAHRHRGFDVFAGGDFDELGLFGAAFGHAYRTHGNVGGVVFGHDVGSDSVAESFDGHGFGADASVQFGSLDARCRNAFVGEDALEQPITESFLQSDVPFGNRFGHDLRQDGVAVHLIEIVAGGRAVLKRHPNFDRDEYRLRATVFFGVRADFHVDLQILKNDAAAGQRQRFK